MMHATAKTVEVTLELTPQEAREIQNELERVALNGGTYLGQLWAALDRVNQLSHPWTLESRT